MCLLSSSSQDTSCDFNLEGCFKLKGLRCLVQQSWSEANVSALGVIYKRKCGKIMTFISVTWTPPNKWHLGLEYVVYCRGGLARLLTETTNQEAGLGRLECQVAVLLLTASLDTPAKVTYVANVCKISSSFPSQQSEVICCLSRNTHWISMLAMLLSSFWYPVVNKKHKGCYYVTSTFVPLIESIQV